MKFTNKIPLNSKHSYGYGSNELLLCSD